MRKFGDREYAPIYRWKNIGYYITYNHIINDNINEAVYSYEYRTSDFGFYLRGSDDRL
ncbi:hypothetical protein ABH899_002793 [Paenibacillus sp. RC84]